MPCACGSTTHKRTSHKSCPLNKKNQATLGNPGSDPAPPVRGHVPGEALEAAGPWRLLPQPSKYELELDSDVKDEILLPRLLKYVDEINMQLESRFSPAERSRGLTGGDIFIKLTGRFTDGRLRLNMGQRLEDKEQGKPREGELLSLMAMLLWVDMSELPLEKRITRLRRYLGEESLQTREALLTLERFKELEEAFRLSDVPVNSAGDHCHNSGDSMRDMRNLEDELYEVGRDICTSKHVTKSMDDEMVESESQTFQSQDVNARKAAGAGRKNDMVAEAFLALPLAVRHKPRWQDNQKEAVSHLLQKVNRTGNCPHTNAWVTADRGFGKWDTAVLLAGFNMMFVMICASMRSFPWTAAHDANSKTPRAKLVEDDQALGREIFTAQREVKKGSFKRTITAAMVRDYPTRKTAALGKANMLRFMEGNTDLAERLRKTFCMTPLPIPSTVQRGEVLFFPCERKPRELRDTEAELGKSAKALTCWQRCADWFELRKLVVTGTTGQALARHDVEARKFLVQSCVGPDAAAALEDPDAESTDAGALSDDSSEPDVQPIVEDEASEASEAPSATDVKAASAAATGAASATVIEPASGEGNTDGGEVLTDKSVFKLLLRGWVFRRGLATKAMTAGTEDEDHVMACLRRKSWVLHIFHVGLLASKAHPCLAVSADAIARVQLPPGEQGECGEHVYASVEIKTRYAPERVQELVRIAREHPRGNYFGCEVGDDLWWRAIPREYRGQVIQQAIVSGLDYVLFCASDQGSLHYVCAVHVPEAVKETYAAAITKWEHLMSWAYEHVDGDTPKVPPSLNVDKEDADVLNTHLPLWSALRAKVTRGPIKPVKVFNTMYQVLYNATMGGVDRTTMYLSDFKMAKRRLDLDKRLATRAMQHQVVNAFSLYRVHVALKDAKASGKTFTSIKSFHMACNEVTTFNDFADDLVFELLRAAGHKQAMQLARASRPIAVSPTLEQAAAQILVSRPKRKSGNVDRVAEFFNKKGKFIRTTGTHVPGREMQVGENGTPKRDGQGSVIYSKHSCALCPRRPTTMCKVCQVGLCTKPPTNAARGSQTCFEKWHENRDLPTSS